MRVLLLGRNGQVGYELERSLQGLGEVIAIDRARMDLADLDQVRDVIRSVTPDLLINAAAYTAVDNAESEPELAMLVNGIAPGVMAEELSRFGGIMIHYSTDYVFDGTKKAPYTECDATSPINAYGGSKLAGELAIQAAGIPHLIFRTSWVYGARGKNFLLTVLRLAKERDELRIVDDQLGSPTWSRTIAEATEYVVAQALAQNDWREWALACSGTYHLTAQGEVTWFGFAKAIIELVMPEKVSCLVPIPTSAYPLLARRPVNSVLLCEKFMANFCELIDWKSALSRVVNEGLLIH